MSIEKSEVSLVVEGARVPVRVRRYAKARTYKLSMDRLRGELRLSVPARGSIKKALAWAQMQQAWISTQLAGQPQQVLLGDGVVVPLEGRDLTVRWEEGRPRILRIEGDQLILGGAPESVGQRVLRFLKQRALEVLEAETFAMAKDNELVVASVGIGDTRSRWGSCTSQGAIRYSWRLILCPSDIRRATVAHELAHILHMDHSPAFHAAHKRIYGADPKPAREWLKIHGAGLHRFIA